MLTARLADAEIEKLADSLSAESRPIRLHAFGPRSAALPLPITLPPYRARARALDLDLDRSSLLAERAYPCRPTVASGAELVCDHACTPFRPTAST